MYSASDFIYTISGLHWWVLVPPDYILQILLAQMISPEILVWLGLMFPVSLAKFSAYYHFSEQLDPSFVHIVWLQPAVLIHTAWRGWEKMSQGVSGPHPYRQDNLGLSHSFLLLWSPYVAWWEIRAFLILQQIVYSIWRASSVTRGDGNTLSGRQTCYQSNSAGRNSRSNPATGGRLRKNGQPIQIFAVAIRKNTPTGQILRTEPGESQVASPAASQCFTSAKGSRFPQLSYFWKGVCEDLRAVPWPGIPEWTASEET
jgi:hypothetical protein